MLLDYALYQVDLHQPEEAIMTLERGIASIDQLLEADRDLGHESAAVNRYFEELTKSIPPSHGLITDDGEADDLRVVDPFGHLLLKQRRL